MTDDKSTEGKTETKTYTQADIDKLNTAIETEKAYAKKHRDDVDAYKTKFDGVDPNEYKTLKEKLAEIEKDKALTGGKEEVEKLIKKAKEDAEADVSKRYSKNLDELTGKNKTLSDRLNRLEVETPIIKIGTEKGINKDMVDLLTILASKELQYDPESGKTFVKDERGEPRYSIKDPRNLMQPDEWVDILRDQKPSMFESGFKNGAGTNGSTAGKAVSTNGLTVDKYLKLSPQDRQALPPDVNLAMAKQVANVN